MRILIGVLALAATIAGCGRAEQERGDVNQGMGSTASAATPEECNEHNGDVVACDAHPGCAYYFCSAQCWPVGTSNCNAGCPTYCVCGNGYCDYNETAYSCPWDCCGRDLALDQSLVGNMSVENTRWACCGTAICDLASEKCCPGYGCLEIGYLCPREY